MTPTAGRSVGVILRPHLSLEQNTELSTLTMNSASSTWNTREGLMTDLTTATILAALILVAAVVSVEFGISVAIIEITFGVVGSSVLGLRPTPWIDFIGSFAGIVLTFMAGAEVDRQLLRREWKPAILIGGLSFLLPFVGVTLFARYVAGWNIRQSEIAGVALSTTSLAVVYAVLVETGLAAS